MKSIRFLKTYLIFLSFLCFGLNISAQGPNRPYLEKVSIHPTTGDITIAWDTLSAPERPAVDEFILYWYEAKPSPNYIPFDTVSKTVLSKTYDYVNDLKMKYPGMPDPRTTSVGFSVTALHKTPESISLQSVRHYNIQVSNTYDSCRSEIQLNWFRYQGWETNNPPNHPLRVYEVIRIHSDGSEEIIDIRGSQDTVFILRNVADRDIFTFYIKAKRNDEEFATSYITTRITGMPIEPAFITAESTQYNSAGLAEISFKIDPSAETYSYQFLGSSRPEYAFVPLGDFNIYGDTVLTDIQFRGKTYYYRLEAWHICKNRITATSNTATALWLTLKQEGPVNLLQWDPYQDWSEDAQYEVFRKIGNADSAVITTIFDPSATAYQDDLSNELIDGDVCYWITATPVSGSSGRSAISNMVCIKPESNIWIPQAFTPNVAGINSEFKPFFSYPPKEYVFYVYDRNGAKVFETKDINAGWNGQLANGKPASEGVYVFYLKFRTELGRLVEKRGTFSLILP